MPSWPWPMKESINLIGGLLGRIRQHYLFKCIHTLSMSNVWHEKFKWWKTYGLVHFLWLNKNSSITCVFRQISQPYQKEFRKTSIVKIAGLWWALAATMFLNSWVYQFFLARTNWDAEARKVWQRVFHRDSLSIGPVEPEFNENAVDYDERKGTRHNLYDTAIHWRIQCALLPHEKGPDSFVLTYKFHEA